jgi:hypothetical protein
MDHGFALLCLAMSRFLARSLHDNSSVEVNLIPAERTGILDSKSTVAPEVVPEVGQAGSLAQTRENDPHIQETTLA